MKTIAIDQLLQWAYGFELLKNPGLLPPGALQSVYGKVLRFGAYGCRPSDGGGDWPWLPDGEGPPHVDALRIDAAVSSLGPQRVEWTTAKAELLGNLAEITPDHPSLTLNATDVGALMVTCARLRRLPYWADEHPIARPWISGRNRVTVIGGLARNRRTYLPGSHCPVRWDPDPVPIALARIEYAAWHGTLLALASTLDGQLEAHRPLPPIAPSRPWAGERIKTPRVLWPAPSILSEHSV